MGKVNPFTAEDTYNLKVFRLALKMAKLSMIKKMGQVGIVVVAYKLPKELERFSTHLTGYRVEAITERDITFQDDGLFNKAACLNMGLKRLINEGCDIIIQTDVDLIIPPELVDYTALHTGDKHLWCPRTTNVRRNPGAFNALSSANWVRVGGFDERCKGWGGEDNILHTRCRELGIKRVELPNCLTHIDHPDRVWRKSDRAKQNYSFRLSKQPNYLI
ncbi:MAG: hypothetical protein BIFFINMI_02389 [Phycisphaerae bacterium]|nr:hypothetical protein [Phycisphaerae bacterium]